MIITNIEVKKVINFSKGIKYKLDSKFAYTDWNAREQKFDQGDILTWDSGSEGYVKVSPFEWNDKTCYTIELCKGNLTKAGADLNAAMGQLGKLKATTIGFDMPDWMDEGNLPF